MTLKNKRANLEYLRKQRERKEKEQINIINREILIE